MSVSVIRHHIYLLDIVTDNVTMIIVGIRPSIPRNEYATNKIKPIKIAWAVKENGTVMSTIKNAKKITKTLLRNSLLSQMDAFVTILKRVLSVPVSYTHLTLPTNREV